jgi:hypothetical protein
MTPTEIITICISTIALVVSFVAIVLQYRHRDNVQFKITKTELVSLQPKNEQDRSFAVVLNLSVFNMGNGPVAIDTLSLSLDGKIQAASDEGATLKPSNRRGDNILIPPLSPEAYSELAFRPVVVSPSAIHTKELVFNLFYYEEGKKYITAKGELKLHGIFYNAKGSHIEVNVPIAEINIKGVRDEEPSYTINFHANEHALHKVEF